MRFAEPLVQAVQRVARDELGVVARAGALLGYIEYPSHYDNGLDSPVGLAFDVTVLGPTPVPRNCSWFTSLPAEMHDEQRAFLTERAMPPRPDR